MQLALARVSGYLGSRGHRGEIEGGKRLAFVSPIVFYSQFHMLLGRPVQIAGSIGFCALK
jgi:hypothetical protein